MKQLWALGCALLILGGSVPGGAISRVGGGKVSNAVEGFSFGVPEQFNRHAEVSEEYTRLNGPMGSNGGRPELLSVTVLNYRDQFAETCGLSQQETDFYFISRGWKKVQSAACGSAYRQSFSHSEVLVATWGECRGMMALGPQHALVVHALDQIRNTLEVDPEVCQWK